MHSALLDDKVWWNVERKLEGICAEIAATIAAGGNVLVLAHFEGGLAIVETALRTRPIEFREFSLFDSSKLCSTHTDGAGKVWAGLARAFQPPKTRGPDKSAAARSGIPLKIVVAERHPLRSRDEQLIQAAATVACQTQLTFHISLDDSLLANFGARSIQQLFKQLGVAEETCLSNSMITTAIRRAQEKIESRVANDLPAASIEDWFKYNLPEK